MERVLSQNEILLDGMNDDLIVTETGSTLRNLPSTSTYEGSSLTFPSYTSVSSSLISQKQQEENTEEINLASLLRKWNLYDELFSFLKGM